MSEAFDYEDMSMLHHFAPKSKVIPAWHSLIDLGEDHGSKVLSSPAQRSYPRAWR